jgi:hypothetical protein
MLVSKNALPYWAHFCEYDHSVYFMPLFVPSCKQL